MDRQAWRITILFVSSLGLAACGGTVVGTGGGTGGAGGTGSTGSTGTTCTITNLPGVCEDNPECGASQCVPLTPGGLDVCTHEYSEASTCMNKGLDQCCTSTDCAGGGKCYDTSQLPSCGGPAMVPHNECIADQCTSDADCTGGGAEVPIICAPSGAFGLPARVCLTAYCHTDADCTAHPCGSCSLVSQSCCSTPAGLACVYPGGCTTDTQCGSNSACKIDPGTGTGVCQAGPIGCPV